MSESGFGAQGAGRRPGAQNVNQSGRLAATLDGAPLPEDEARALWTAFSHYMDEHRGDTDGFARQRGYASVTPTHRAGRAVLVIRTAEAAIDVGRDSAFAGPSIEAPQPRRGRKRRR